MAQQIYSLENSEYLDKNPNWHIEDSPWKATQIIKMLDRNKLAPKTIAEIGCGAGEILNQLHQRLPDKTVELSGYEIAPDAMRLNAERAKPRLRFFHGDLLEINASFDLLLMMDVFEHVEDYRGFIRKSAQKATYKIYHIPLDVSVNGVIRNVPGKARESVGHIHYFTKDTALSTLKDTGQEIIDYFYTSVMIEVHNKKLSTKLLNIPRRILYSIAPDLTVKLFGGYSLLVLTK
jgi:SAM-dependent methyltransferase